ERGPDFVQSLERGLAVIRVFNAERPSLTLSEVAAATGVTRAAARRFLITLMSLGYVRSDGRQFSLSPRVLDGDEIIYVARVPVSRIMTVAISVGTRFPAYATSMGRVLLAGLPDGELED